MSSTEDHFNWPMPNKRDTMYLSTIGKGETGFQRMSFIRDKDPLNIDDIEKSKPYYPGANFTNKESFINKNEDISGSHPKKLHQPLNKEYYYMKNEDIIGSKPKYNKFVTTRSPTDPLNPDYKLPQVEIRLPTPPKFIRDQIDISDINGAAPNPYFKYKIERKNLTVDDIDGAKPKKEWIPQGKINSLDVRDINYFWEFHTKRSTNPLSPRYKIPDENNKAFEYGNLDNKSIVRHPQVVQKDDLALKTQDIKGAQAGTSVQHIHNIATRDKLLKTEDIPGAQISSLKKGMSTKRTVNPLVPEYVIPGHSEPTPVYSRNTQAPNKSQTQGKFLPRATNPGQSGAFSHSNYSSVQPEATNTGLSKAGESVVTKVDPANYSSQPRKPSSGNKESSAKPKTAVERFDKFIS